jgi:serine/threonine protein kinase
MSEEKFGRYLIKSEIGRGGMATVILAYDPRFERDVAIKVLPREFLHDAQFRARFEREAKTVALLEHPAIVPVYDFGDEEGQPYIVMRYMSGGSLADRMHQGAISTSEVIQIFTRLGPALDAAHARGIIHRDLKPGNILFDQYGNAFLSDFGIARMAQATGTTLTGGNILGTPAYMSPEQVSGDKEIDGRSDIYAMGVILYQLLTGNAPYQATTPARVMMMHILDPVPDIRQALPNLPQGIAHTIIKAMAKEPGERYQTMSEMSDAMVSALAEPITPSRGIPADATLVSTSKTEMKTSVKAPQKTAIAPREGQPKASRTISMLPAALIGLALIAFITVVGVGGFIYLQTRNAQATQNAAVALAGNTPSLTAPTRPSDTPLAEAGEPALSTNTSAPEPTGTEAEVAAGDPSSATPEATSTHTPEPSPTQPEQPSALTVGGADKIAFISNRDVWVANLDGSELTQLTQDGAAKNRLQWLPDGSGLVYIQGKCAKTVSLEKTIDVITCFETAAYFDDFAVSPDASQVAITLDHEYLYIVPFDNERLSQVRFRNDLIPLGTCEYFAPYGPFQFKDVQWSKDSALLAMVIGAPVSGRVQDIIEVRNFSACAQIPSRVGVQFPTNFFTMKGYSQQPYILNFGWDGEALFALTGIVRNGGFGDLYIYNTVNNWADLEVNPVGGICCYRDPSWSPDGRYLTFAYQAISQLNKIEIYVVPYGSFRTGEVFQPLPLPEELFSIRDESPQPVLRPAPNP